LGYTFSRARHKEAADFFHISDRQLYTWLDSGCPRNEDETYDLYKIHEWLLKKAKPEGEENFKAQKLEQEVLKLKLLNAKLNDEMVDRSEMENILLGRATSLRLYFERGLTINRHVRAMRTIEELVTLDYDFVKGMMDAYTGSNG
jgi:hypothetical protein